MEYIIILLLVVIVGVIAFKNPNRFYGHITKIALDQLKNRKVEVVVTTYQKLPADIKKKVDQKTYVAIVGYVIDVASQIIEKEVVAQPKSKDSKNIQA
jgi:hypothetical protein